jgi:hypothetical protein
MRWAKLAKAALGSSDSETSRGTRSRTQRRTSRQRSRVTMSCALVGLRAALHGVEERLCLPRVLQREHKPSADLGGAFGQVHAAFTVCVGGRPGEARQEPGPPRRPPAAPASGPSRAPPLRGFGRPRPARRAPLAVRWRACSQPAQPPRRPGCGGPIRGDRVAMCPGGGFFGGGDRLGARVGDGELVQTLLVPSQLTPRRAVRPTRARLLGSALTVRRSRRL